MLGTYFHIKGRVKVRKYREKVGVIILHRQQEACCCMIATLCRAGLSFGQAKHGETKKGNGALVFVTICVLYSMSMIALYIMYIYILRSNELGQVR